jgi:hypothetical protein
MHAAGNCCEGAGTCCCRRAGRCIVAPASTARGVGAGSNFVQVSLVVAAIAAALISVPASAEETCHAFESQFAKERICVSSVLAPQAGNTFRSSHDG